MISNDEQKNDCVDRWSTRLECVITNIKGLRDTQYLLGESLDLNDTLIDNSLVYFANSLDEMRKEVSAIMEFVFSIERALGDVREEVEFREKIEKTLPMLAYALH